MKRDKYNQLLQWKERRGRKPLILRGARQVGKTWLLKAFGQNQFRRMHYINFEQRGQDYDLFAGSLAPRDLLRALEVVLNADIDPAQDLLVFDEVQERPRALTSLKYFSEEMPELAVCCAGSHIGLLLNETSFPVGQVEFMSLYPLSFGEFLRAHQPRASTYLADSPAAEALPEAVHQLLWNELKLYYATGGLPEAVQAFLDQGGEGLGALQAARAVQQRLMVGYQSDFAKHAGKENAAHINRVFENIPEQLARVVDDSVGKYRFRGVIPNRSKFAQFAGPIDWLVRSGLALQVYIIEQPSLPLRSRRKANTFKLYLFDVGLLGCMLDLSLDAIVNQEYGNYKGFVAENFVAQELAASSAAELYSWRGRLSEIEFLRVVGDGIAPVEVKSGVHTRSKSLAVYREKYGPPASLKLSALNGSKGERGILNAPLYRAGQVDQILAEAQ
ncbi:MAG: AAA family ATPase [Candidatus Latescibacteria bacterium]|nr:AAA family ATPase [Candidatus Latescibacterota bacterium]